MISVARLNAKLKNVYYGWWIVVGAILIQTLQIGLLGQGYSVYIPALQAEFGWSTTLLAGAFSVLQAVSGLLGPVQGWLLIRFGPRTLMRAGMVLFGLAFLAFSQVTSLAAFFTAFILMAVGYSLGGFLSLTTTVVNWFERRRSSALALMQLGVSLGGLALPLIAWSLTALGWRNTSFLSGLIILLVGVPLTQLMRESPDDATNKFKDKSQDADAASRRQSPATAALGAQKQAVDQRTLKVARREFTVQEALRTRTFWLLGFGHALALLIVSAVNVHAVLHLSAGLGYSLPAAAGFVSLMTAFTVLGQLVGGVLGDRYPKRLLAMMAMWVHAAALLALTYATSTAMVVLFAAGHGLAWGTRGPLMQAIRADYFGRKAFATIMGYSFLIAMLGTMGGPLIAGAFADAFGNYRVGFTILAGMAACGSVFFLLAREP